MESPPSLKKIGIQFLPVEKKGFTPNPLNNMSSSESKISPTKNDNSH